MFHLKKHLSRLALAGVMTAGLAAAMPGPGVDAPPGNSLSTEQARKIAAPIHDGDQPVVLKENPVVRNVHFQRFRR